MSERENIWPEIGICVPRMLLPVGADMEKYAVVACDQYTSQPEYWEETRRLAAGAPSVLNMMLPEVYLGQRDREKRIGDIDRTISSYMSAGILAEQEPGIMFVERQVSAGIRRGFVLAVDLEKYDYVPENHALIRATEKTVVERIPPRLEIRRRAKAEFSHVMLLANDPENRLLNSLTGYEPDVAYDFDLMQRGGHIRGSWVRGDALESMHRALDVLLLQAGRDPMLFAVGDGNHSLATAKAFWEEIRKDIPRNTYHPARYALVELVNLYDPALVFEPIHRVTFGCGDITERLKRLPEMSGYETEAVSTAEMLARQKAEKGIGFGTFCAGTCLWWNREGKREQLAVAVLQSALDSLKPETDYIHGEEAALSLAEQKGSCAFLLPAMNKLSLFPAVQAGGTLPRKTFSMGHANEKRYYIEGRRLR